MLPISPLQLSQLDAAAETAAAAFYSYPMLRLIFPTRSSAAGKPAGTSATRLRSPSNTAMYRPPRTSRESLLPFRLNIPTYQ